jgi:hypothetical protein
MLNKAPKSKPASFGQMQTTRSPPIDTVYHDVITESREALSQQSDQQSADSNCKALKTTEANVHPWVMASQKQPIPYPTILLGHHY